jgi:serine/threonine protein phosphatase PrpC
MSTPLIVSYKKAGYEWHYEDAAAAGANGKVLAVADGVTLPMGLYPNIGPRVVAETFCRETVGYLEGKSEITGSDLAQACLVANEQVFIYNQSRHASYAATAALAVVQDETILATRVTDCGIALVRDGKLIEKTPEFWSYQKAQGKNGYGIVNGEKGLEKYLDQYQWSYQVGDYLVLFSDGFENHFSSAEFLHLFTGDLSDFTEKLKIVDLELRTRDEKLYGSERTLIVSRI